MKSDTVVVTPETQDQSLAGTMIRLRLTADVIARIENGVLHTYVKLDDLKAVLAHVDSLEGWLRYISDTLCGVKVEGEVTYDMVAAFVEGQIDKQSDRADTAQHLLARAVGFLKHFQTISFNVVGMESVVALVDEINKIFPNLPDLAPIVITEPVMGPYKLVEKRPEQAELEQCLEETATAIRASLGSPELPMASIMDQLRAFSDKVRGIREDLTARYYLDSRFHRFVDQFVVRAMLDDEETTLDQQVSALHEIEGMGYAKVFHGLLNLRTKVISYLAEPSSDGRVIRKEMRRELREMVLPKPTLPPCTSREFAQPPKEG